jgi:hypothetical protein
VALLVLGGLTFLEAPRLQANLPTPWIGLWERINISVFLLWDVMLCAVLWRTETPQGETPQSRPSPFNIPEGEARCFRLWTPCFGGSQGQSWDNSASLSTQRSSIPAL